MDKMLALLGDHPPCLLFNQLFVEHLPADIRIQLVDAKIEDHRALAKHADALWECRDAGMKSYAVHKPPPMDNKQLTKTLCFYTRTFGEAAKQCRPPCSWTLRNEKAGHR